MMLLYIFLLGLSGMLAHWFKRRVRKQTSLNLIKYIITNKKASINAFIALICALFTLVQGGLTDLSSMQDIATVFLAGFACDSTINSEEE